MKKKQQCSVIKMGVELAIGAALLGLGSTAYSISETKRQEKKVERDTKKAKAQEQARIQARNDKIQGMKSRLFSTSGGLFGEEVEDKNIIGN